MSVESLAIALHHSRATGTARLVVIGIANHDGDGGAWPAVSTLQKYAGGIDRRAVQRALTKLEQLGEIRRVIGQGGDHSTADHRRPNLYRFLLSCPHDCDHTSNHRTARDKAAMLPFEVDGAVIRPHAVEEPPRGSQTTGRGGHTTAQTITTNHLHLVKETTSSTPAGVNEDALTRGDIHVASQADYQRELRSKCPNRASGAKHVYPNGTTCAYCGIRPDQYWHGKDIITDPTWRNA